MSITSVTTFLTASLILAGIALAFLVLSVAVVAVPYFVANHRTRVARREPLIGYYRRQIILG